MVEDRLARILGRLSDRGDDGRSAIVLCEAATEILGVSGAGVMLMSGDMPMGTLCATNAVSALIEDLQYTMGQGPCVDAYENDEVVLEPDLAAPLVPRWLVFTPKALEAGVRAMFGFPLRVGVTRLGALNLYQDQPRSLDDRGHADALILAELIAQWVMNTQ